MLKICNTLVMILLVISVTTAEPTCPVIAKDESCGVQLELAMETQRKLLGIYIGHTVVGIKDSVKDLAQTRRLELTEKTR
jgi:hypothetical protein